MCGVGGSAYAGWTSRWPWLSWKRAHVFVEKPLALSVAAGQAILDAVHRTGRKLAVGHIERFNPAVVELKHLLDEGQLGRIFQLRSLNVLALAPRVEDVGVVFDLATHEVAYPWST